MGEEAGFQQAGLNAATKTYERREPVRPMSGGACFAFEHGDEDRREEERRRGDEGYDDEDMRGDGEEEECDE